MTYRDTGFGNFFENMRNARSRRRYCVGILRRVRRTKPRVRCEQIRRPLLAASADARGRATHFLRSTVPVGSAVPHISFRTTAHWRTSRPRSAVELPCRHAPAAAQWGRRGRLTVLVTGLIFADAVRVRMHVTLPQWAPMRVDRGAQGAQLQASARRPLIKFYVISGWKCRLAKNSPTSTSSGPTPPTCQHMPRGCPRRKQPPYSSAWRNASYAATVTMP